jgi:hypothetical protein
MPADPTRLPLCRSGAAQNDAEPPLPERARTGDLCGTTSGSNRTRQFRAAVLETASRSGAAQAAASYFYIPNMLRVIRR